MDVVWIVTDQYEDYDGFNKDVYALNSSERAQEFANTLNGFYGNNRLDHLIEVLKKEIVSDD